MNKSIKQKSKIVSCFSILLVVVCVLSSSMIFAVAPKPIPEAQNVKVKEIYKGVTLTSFEVSQSSSYTMNKFKIVEFDPKQSDLYIDVTNAADYSNKLRTVMQTVNDMYSKALQLNQ